MAGSRVNAKDAVVGPLSRVRESALNVTFLDSPFRGPMVGRAAPIQLVTHVTARRAQ